MVCERFCRSQRRPQRHGRCRVTKECTRHSFWVSGPDFHGAAAIGGVAALPIMLMNGILAAVVFVLVSLFVCWRSARLGVEVCPIRGVLVLHHFWRTRSVPVGDVSGAHVVLRRDRRFELAVGSELVLLPGVGLPGSRTLTERDRLWLKKLDVFLDALVDAGVDEHVVAAVRTSCRPGSP